MTFTNREHRRHPFVVIHRTPVTSRVVIVIDSVPYCDAVGADYIEG
jgi:hypothetical protein